MSERNKRQIKRGLCVRGTFVARGFFPRRAFRLLGVHRIALRNAMMIKPSPSSYHFSNWTCPHIPRN
jgi:hypothetical protein